jgi:TetR/AcrR family transcriptional regulator
MGRLKKKDDSLEATVRSRVLAGALKLFNSKGYAATTVREIVAEAGVTKPVLYYYFGNKEGIYLELVSQPFEKLDALFEGFHSMEGSVAEKLTDLCDTTFQHFCEHLETARMMYSIYYGPHQGAPFFDFEVYHGKLQDTIRQLIEEGISKGEFKKRNAKDAMWAIVGALGIVMEMQLCHHPPQPVLDRDGLHRILNVIFQGILKD